MSGTDPLASPTLAQLYLSQGRIDSARGTVRTLLERDPFSGAALVLASRLAHHDAPTLELRRDDVPGPGTASRLLVTLRGGPVRVADAAHVVLTTYPLDGRGHATPRVTSQPLPPPRTGPSTGATPIALEFDGPGGPAAAVASLARLDHGRLVVLAVARAISW